MKLSEYPLLPIGMKVFVKKPFRPTHNKSEFCGAIQAHKFNPSGRFLYYEVVNDSGESYLYILPELEPLGIK